MRGTELGLKAPAKSLKGGSGVIFPCSTLGSWRVPHPLRYCTRQRVTIDTANRPSVIFGPICDPVRVPTQHSPSSKPLNFPVPVPCYDLPHCQYVWHGPAQGSGSSDLCFWTASRGSVVKSQLRLVINFKCLLFPIPPELPETSTLSIPHYPLWRVPVRQTLEPPIFPRPFPVWRSRSIEDDHGTS